VFAESPAALRGGLAIYEAFSSSSLSPAEQQIVMLAVSEANDCEYCVAAHSTLAKRFAKVDPAVVDAVRRRAPIADVRLDALARFTRKVVERRGMLADGEVDAFLGVGYTRAQVIEVLLGVGMKTFNNYVDHIAHTPLNDQFKADAWQPKREAA
jgi:AhpD family alkylhydroperoxidase